MSVVEFFISSKIEREVDKLAAMWSSPGWLDAYKDLLEAK